MGEWKEKANSRREFRQGVNDPEIAKHKSKASKKPWVIENKYTGEVDPKSFWARLNLLNTDWKVCGRYKKERDAQTALAVCESGRGFGVFGDSEKWEYQIKFVG